jgi:hypothetical protein
MMQTIKNAKAKMRTVRRIHLAKLFAFISTPFDCAGELACPSIRPAFVECRH